MVEERAPDLDLLGDDLSVYVLAQRVRQRRTLPSLGRRREE